NLSTTALMERVPSRWPHPEWHAPWFCEQPQQLSNEKFSTDVSLQAMGGKAENETSACFYEYRDLPRKMCNMGKRTHEGRSRTVLLHAFIDPNPEGPWLAALRIPLST
ncbi:hypothetical protein Tco_0278327, partial [Tanacetum coccineum]